MQKPIHLYNSLGRELKEFTPLTPGNVLMYSCGPTVYNYAHIGNLRAYIFTDTLRRVLQWKGLNVKHVMNITDVGHLTSDADEGEDKMEQSASKQGKTVWEIAQFYTDHFFSDIDQLNILRPTTVCKATDNIPEMIDFAKELDKKGFTYVLDDGLYFDISKLPEYGKIALLDLEGQEAGARVAVKQGKRNPADFAIWRFSPKDQKRLMEWDSPWGVGAPGWHLECSVMSINELGQKFDIHTGGIDHRQVHHCNEIAQNQAYLGNNNPGADWWIHNEFLVLSNTEKMSKSSGNFLRLKSLVDIGVTPIVYRYFCLQASYRTPLEFSRDALISAHKGFTRLIKRIQTIRNSTNYLPRRYEQDQLDSGTSLNQTTNALSCEISSLLDDHAPSFSNQISIEFLHGFEDAISNDLNTAKALGLLSKLVTSEIIPPEVAVRIIELYDLVLGLRLLHTEALDLNIPPGGIEAEVDVPEIRTLISMRAEAKKNRDFALADSLREQLIELGVSIKDTKDGETTWEWLPKNN